MTNKIKVAVIGGGAAGFFSAIQVKSNYPTAEVVLYEKTNKLLAKVRISGGGRCNVTNGCRSIKELVEAYPRGGRSLKKLFKEFNTAHSYEWFESRGVPLKTEADGRVFPQSDSSESIVNCLMQEVKTLGIQIKTQCPIVAVRRKADQWHLELRKGEQVIYDKVIIATGGSPKISGLKWLADLGHKIESPVPSLFTFNMPKHPITKLMGVVSSAAMVGIQGAKLKSSGPLLITHWGMSGPAVLKLSAHGARTLADMNYRFTAQVNWINIQNHADVTSALTEIVKEHPRKRLASIKPFDLPERLWNFLIEKTSLDLIKPWSELGKKGINKLVTILVNDTYPVNGKTTFKEEFVTCGGVSLESIDMKTMQSRMCPGLYFSGEVMDIDGVTGGYNFQAAWTTGFIAGKLN